MTNFCCIKFDQAKRNAHTTFLKTSLFMRILTRAYILANFILVVAGVPWMEDLPWTDTANATATATAATANATAMVSATNGTLVDHKYALRFPSILMAGVSPFLVVPVVLMLSLVNYLCGHLWNYGTLYAWQITAHRFNGWAGALLLSILVSISMLLPLETSRWTYVCVIGRHARACARVCVEGYGGGGVD
jgi:hypothetical protein